MSDPAPFPGDDLPDAAPARPARTGEEGPGVIRRSLDFRQDVTRALSRRVIWALVACALVSAGAIPLAGGPTVWGLAALLGIRGSAYIKVLFCILQVPLAACLVMALFDLGKRRMTREGFIVIAGVLAGLWCFAFALLDMAGNWARYGF